MSTEIVEAFEPRHAELWGKQTVRLRHALAVSEMFSDGGLADLIDALPRERVSINTMAGQGHRQDSWSYCDRDGQSGANILDIAKRGRLWINMTRLETADRRFAGLLDRMLDEFESLMPGFRTFKRSIGLLISSPGAQVFYHADVPGQSLWQIRGRKRIHIYPAEEPFLRPADIENVVRGITEEEIAYKPWFDDYAEAHDLDAGDMLHWKLNGPHRVVNLDSLNVSITTEHWTPATRRNYAMNYGNGVLRQLGWKPRSRAIHGPAFWGKVALTAFWRKSGLHREQSYKRAVKYRIDPEQESGLVPLEGR